jgi:hypothetical protein
MWKCGERSRCGDNVMSWLAAKEYDESDRMYHCVCVVYHKRMAYSLMAVVPTSSVRED